MLAHSPLALSNKQSTMSLTNKRLLVSFLAVCGIAVSLYLTYVKLTGSPIKCTVGSCDIVQNSKYAELFGIPVAVFGVLFYFLLFLFTYYKTYVLLKLWSLWGFIFSLYLTYLEIYVIKEICQWCVISAVLSTVAFFVALSINNQEEA